MTTTVNLDDEALFTCIAGAGASTYCWYDRFVPDWDGLKLHVKISLEDVEGEATLTPDSLRQTIAALVEAGIAYPVNGVDWSDEECDSDVDADIADCVIQYALLNDVVFG